MNRVISFSQGIVNRFLLGTVAEAVTFICKKTECEGTLALRIPLTRPNFGLERTQEVQEVLLLRCRKRIEVAHHCGCLRLADLCLLERLKEMSVD